MRRLARFGSVCLRAFLAAYLWLAQPGLCPYWLVADTAPLSAPASGDGHTSQHHDHNEHRQLFVTTTAPALPQPLLPLHTLLAWLAASAPRLPAAEERRLVSASLTPAPLVPPPRA